ncbi:hypothetical protein HKBW3S33_02019 [Candidatus Hakubella thermalkaliphila]|uniref:Uncharacterized protein n=1 Tax=Candidatus Hakubella thermalkaliphila TaxID=2754717 RepID=A0A6V8P7I7_9ACTN|nr:hypothetical protein HKBW3S33_02019 [Candidatus Hakubella thermalkaliphila]
MRIGFQAGDLPIALRKGKTGHFTNLSKKRSQIGSDEKDQAHDDQPDKQGPKEIPPVRSHTPDHKEKKQSQIGKGQQAADL